MGLKRIAFISVLALAAVAGIIGGQFAMLKHFESRGFGASALALPGPEHQSNEVVTADATENLIEVEAQPGTIHMTDLSEIENLFQDSSLQLKERDELPGHVQITSGSGAERRREKPSNFAANAGNGPQLDSALIPGQLPELRSASPIQSNQAAHDELMRQILIQELPKASAEEREVWIEELRGLPPRMARELLRLRNLIGTSQPAKIRLEPQFSFSKSVIDLPAKIVSQPTLVGSPQTEIPAIESSIAAIRIARDVLLNNIANANTTAFRRSRVLFEDLAYQQIKLPGRQDRDGKSTPVGVAVGFGVQVAGIECDTTPGKLQATGNRLHLAIEGEGYFQVQSGAEILYTRSGTFSLNSDGEIVLSSAQRGRLLEPAITVPQDATQIEISSEGIVSILQAESTSLAQVGQIQTVRFVNSNGLLARGENLFTASDASGVPLIGSPGQAGLGQLKQGYLEASNVNLPDELAGLKRLQSRLQALEEARTIIAGSQPAASISRIAISPRSTR